MAPFATVYTYPNNYRIQRAEAIAALNGLELHIDPNFQMGVTNKTEEFTKKFPLGKVPALETADGFYLAEGAAIAKFIAASGPKAAQLLGTGDVRAFAKIEEWAAFAESEISTNILPSMLMCLAKMIPFDEAAYDAAAAKLVRALKKIEATVQDGRKFLVGDQLTLADLMVAAPLITADKFLIDAEMRKEIPAVIKYLEGLIEAVPEIKATSGTLAYCEKRLKL